MAGYGGFFGALFALAVLGSPAAAQPAPAPDALKVTLCGTSGPLPIKDRAKACVAVEAGGKLYVVDTGPGSTQNLQTWRMPLATLSAVFITHLHSDHIGDLGELNMQSWVAGRPAALPVVGPEGVQDLAAGFNRAYSADHRYRNAHHEHGVVKLPIALGELKAVPIVSPKTLDPAHAQTMPAWADGPLTVTAILVNHAPVAPAFAYRFDYKGRSVVISGDTRVWPPLAEAAKGADVLIHEAQNPDMTRMTSQGLTMQGNPRMASIMADTLSYHTSPVEAAQLAKTAGVKALVLTHLTQAGLPFYNEAAFTKGMNETGFTAWRLGSDGTTITLPVGSSEVTFGQR